MICPECRAEYRQGFTRCADCDVELVQEMPAAGIVRQAAAAEPGDAEEDPFCSFWTGDDPRILAELCELMDKEKIPHKTVRREDHLFHLSNFPAFQIGIPFSMFERAEAAVQEAYGGGEAIQSASRLLPVDSDHIPGTRFDGAEDESRGRPSWWSGKSSSGSLLAENSEELPGPGNSGIADREGAAGSLDAEDTVARVWSGDEPEMAEFLAASLETNEIAIRHETSGGKHTLYVLAEEEKRAREIVREVIEGAPPE